MTNGHAKRGLAPVGHVIELDEIEAVSVIYLRLWSKGHAFREEIKSDLIASLGLKRGEHAMQSFESLCMLCDSHGRRPIMQRTLRCKCLGSDEACFSNFVATATEGERDDAMLIATLMFRADVAPLAASLASDFGLALKQMNLAALGKFDALNQPQQTLH